MSLKTKDLVSHRWRLIATAIAFAVLVFSTARAEQPVDHNTTVDAYLAKYVAEKENIYFLEQELVHAQDAAAKAEAALELKTKRLNEGDAKYKELLAKHSDVLQAPDSGAEGDFKVSQMSLSQDQQNVNALNDAVEKTAKALSDAKDSTVDIDNGSFKDQINSFKDGVALEKSVSTIHKEVYGSTPNSAVPTNVLNDRAGKIRRLLEGEAKVKAQQAFYDKYHPAPPPPAPTAPAAAVTPTVITPTKPAPAPLVAPLVSCQDQAMQAIAKNLKDGNADVLGKLFNLAAMKMAYKLEQTKDAKKRSLKNLEEYYTLNRSTLDPALAPTGFSDDLKKTYAEYGEYADLTKISTDSNKNYYYKYKHEGARLTNDNASAIVLLLSKAPSDKSTPAISDFTETDAASIWAVEKIRLAHASDSSYKIGNLNGNLMNFSTRVEQLVSAKNKVTSANIETANAEVSAMITAATTSVSDSLKSCPMGCPSNTLAKVDGNVIQFIQKSLLQSMLKEKVGQNGMALNAAGSSVTPVDGKPAVITIQMDPVIDPAPVSSK
jgi:hypothetical protein